MFMFSQLKAVFLLTLVIIGEQTNKNSTTDNKKLVIKIVSERNMGWVRMVLGIRSIMLRNQDEKITQQERVGSLLWTREFIIKDF